MKGDHKEPKLRFADILEKHIHIADDDSLFFETNKTHQFLFVMSPIFRRFRKRATEIGTGFAEAITSGNRILQYGTSAFSLVPFIEHYIE